MNSSTLSEKKDRDLLLISVFTFFTVTLWIFFEVLKTIKTTTVTPEVTKLVIPLSPKIDPEIFSMIANKKQY